VETALQMEAAQHPMETTVVIWHAREMQLKSVGDSNRLDVYHYTASSGSGKRGLTYVTVTVT